MSYVELIERPGMRLSAEAEAEYEQWQVMDRESGCRCCISPPCEYCIHPGNPNNLNEDDDAWEPCND